jgi:2-amino-4-hydroxy-6-hydroxymethyldihydropteridine diphosphokinase
MIDVRQRAFIGIGSNLDGPKAQIAGAIDRLARLPDSAVETTSSMYLSAPFGPVAQPDFVNAVAELRTALSASGLLRQLQRIERLMGRQQDGERWGPRIIDLDLLVYGDHLIHEDDLVVPHPGIRERNFVLLPLQEIAPELVIPGLGPVADIQVNCVEPRILRVD